MKSTSSAAPAADSLVAGGPRPTLGRLDAVAIIVGIVIGAGIFGTPPLVAGVSGDPGWAVLMWVAGGLISLVGALCYAELATTFPHPGGDYHFVTRAFGHHVSFLYAWARAMVINTGAIASLAFLFGDYLSRVLPLGAGSSAWWAAIIVVALTVINLIGLRASAGAQKVLTAIEVAGVVAVAIAGLVAAQQGGGGVGAAAFSSTPALGMAGLAMVFVLFTYGGWNEAAYISAELKGGERAIVSALVISIALIAVVYVAVNVSLLLGLGLKGLAGSKAAGVDVMERAFGATGGQLIGIAVAIAALTSINATMIVGARTNFAIARDWRLLAFMGGWNTERGTPVRAYLVQAAIALVLIAFGAMAKDGFSEMVQFTAPVFWFFFLLTGVSLFVLRVREPDVRRPFRVPLYPLTPIIFCVVAGYLLYSSIAYAASQQAVHVSLLVMAAGIVALLITALARPTAR